MLNYLAGTEKDEKMNFKTKGYFASAAGLLTCGYLISFIIYYLANYIYASDALSYVWMFFQRISYLLLPSLASVVMLAASPFVSGKKLLISAIPLSLARIIFFIPCFYLIFIVDGFDSVESLAFGLLLSLAEATVSYCISAIIFVIMNVVINKRGGKKSRESLITKRTTLDFEDPTALAFAVISFVCFLYFFISEIINTVSFFIDYAGSMTPPEIIFTVVSYIVDALIIFIYFYAMSFVKNLIISKRLKTQDTKD